MFGPVPVRTRRSILHNAGPEMLARKVAFLAAQASDGDRTLPFEKPDHRCHLVFGGNGDAHMHMVRHQMALDNLAFLLPGQRVEDRTQLPAHLPENGFPTPFGHKNYVVLRGTCSPIWNGIGSGKALTLHPPHRWSSSHLRRIYSRNGQTCSSLTGRTSGLPISVIYHAYARYGRCIYPTTLLSD
jgi:hypothetical protein